MFQSMTRDDFLKPLQPDRIGYVDAVRVVLILLVVAHHSVEPYVTAHPPEIPLPDAPLARAGVFLWVNAAFFMGLFFFLAGYFTPGAAGRKGAASFLADRGSPRPPADPTDRVVGAGSSRYPHADVRPALGDHANTATI